MSMNTKLLWNCIFCITCVVTDFFFSAYVDRNLSPTYMKIIYTLNEGLLVE